MSKTIPLTQGYEAIVDDEDYEELSKYRWRADKNHGNVYARRNLPRKNGKRGSIFMHRQIMGSGAPMIDHEDNNGLNNKRQNLKFTNHFLNGHNRKNAKGYHWVESRKKWNSKICIRGKTKNLGYFRFEKDAKEAYAKAKMELV